MKRTRVTRVMLAVTVSALALLAKLAGGQDSSANAWPDSPSGDVVVRSDVEKQLLYIEIPARDGRVAWSDVLEALMRAGHLNDQAMRDKLPTGALDLRASYSRYAIAAVNLLLGADIRLQIVAGDRDASRPLARHGRRGWRVGQETQGRRADSESGNG